MVKIMLTAIHLGFFYKFQLVCPEKRQAVNQSVTKINLYDPFFI